MPPSGALAAPAPSVTLGPGAEFGMEPPHPVSSRVSTAAAALRFSARLSPGRRLTELALKCAPEAYSDTIIKGIFTLEDRYASDELERQARTTVQAHQAGP